MEWCKGVELSDGMLRWDGHYASRKGIPIEIPAEMRREEEIKRTSYFQLFTMCETESYVEIDRMPLWKRESSCG